MKVTSLASKDNICFQAVGKWRALAEQSKWDDFVAAMLQEHYDVVYARAQAKYLTPSPNQGDTEDDARASVQAPNNQTQTMSSGLNGDAHEEHLNGSSPQITSSTKPSSHESEGSDQEQGGVADTVQAAGALSHLFGGPRQKLMQQMGTKQSESTLRWHREPVEDIRDDIYSALASKLLSQYDPAALRRAQ